MTKQPIEASPQIIARIAGLCYLAVIAGGLFAEAGVAERITVASDAAATAAAIAANETLWRWGIAVHLLYLLPGLVMNLLIYELLKRAGATLARLALIAALVSLAIEAVSVLFLYMPLATGGSGGALAAMNEGQRQALGYLGIRLYSVGFGFALVFFAGFCVLNGLLILRSRLVPRPIGALMILAGLCYFVNSVTAIVAPPLSTVLFPWILLPGLIAESSLALWLTAMGVNVRRWQEEARRAS
jgi:hypothetical protein